MPREHWSLAGAFSVPVRVAIRPSQFCLAVVTIGLFATDISNPSRITTHIYAFVVAVISILTDAFHCLVTVKHGGWLVVDFGLVVLWAALAGTVGTSVLRHKGDESKLGSLEGGREKLFVAATAIAVVSMCLWLASCLYGCAWCFAQRRRSNREDIELPEDDVKS